MSVCLAEKESRDSWEEERERPYRDWRNIRGGSGVGDLQEVLNNGERRPLGSCGESGSPFHEMFL